MTKLFKKFVKLITHRIFLIPLLMILQIALIVFIILKYNKYFVHFYILSMILSFAMAIYIINGRSNPGYKIAWLIPIMGLPIFGLILYLIFGMNQLSNREKNKLRAIYYKGIENRKSKDLVMEELRYESISAHNQAKYICDYSPSTVCKHTKTTYLESGTIYFEKLITALKKAHKYIFLEYFIIKEGYMWNNILEILKEKVAEGVDVRLIYDDLGCIVTLPNHYEKKLNKLGIKTVVFNKFIPRLRSRFNNRDHRKIAVIDGLTCFTGGINLADEYMNKEVRFGYWKDNGIMLEGAAAWNFTTMFLEMWDFVTGTSENYKDYEPPHELIYTTPSDGYIIPYEDNPWDHEAVGETIYLNLINKANRYIYITTPYLIIDNEMITALTTAAKRGVDVRIITPGIPDKKIVNEVTKAYYDQLIDGGIKIYEFTKGFVHEKTFVVDDEYATVGTVNLDYRSLYLHFECGVWLYASSTIHNIKKDVQKTLKESREIKKKGIEKLSFLKNLKRQILKAFAPLM